MTEQSNYEVRVTGFKTKAQAEEFMNWYSGQGEQDASIWFECRKAEGTLDVDFMPADSFSDWNGNTIEMNLKI